MAIPDLTLLKAVNRMLRAAGEFPVNSLSADGVNDTIVAEDTLNEASLQVQMGGLVCNTADLTLNPDSSGYVQLPAGTLSIEHCPDSDEELLVLAIRATRVWNVTDSTAIFTEPITVRAVVGQEFEDLPIAIRFQIVEIAVRAYQMEVAGEPFVDRVLAERAQQARIEGRRADMQSRKANIFRDNADLYNAVDRGPTRIPRR